MKEQTTGGRDGKENGGGEGGPVVMFGNPRGRHAVVGAEALTARCAASYMTSHLQGKKGQVRGRQQNRVTRTEEELDEGIAADRLQLVVRRVDAEESGGMLEAVREDVEVERLQRLHPPTTGVHRAREWREEVRRTEQGEGRAGKEAGSGRGQGEVPGDCCFGTGFQRGGGICGRRKRLLSNCKGTVTRIVYPCRTIPSPPPVSSCLLLLVSLLFLVFPCPLAILLDEEHRPSPNFCP
eukprot:596664-Hanusia_phi.AAC.1